MYLSHQTTLFCDSTLFSQHHTFGLHCRVWGIDWLSREGYNGSVVMAPNLVIITWVFVIFGESHLTGLEAEVKVLT